MSPPSPSTKPRTSLAGRTSWASLGLALGGIAVLLFFQGVDQLFGFERGSRGVLSGFLPRLALYVAWAAEAFAVVAAAGCFFMIRRTDKENGTIGGIIVRALCGLAVGFIGSVLLWLVVGHIVIGF